MTDDMGEAGVPGAVATARERLVRGLRLLALGAVVLALVGVADRLATIAAVTATIGPTAYLLLAHPEHPTARTRNALTGHVVAVAIGLGALAAFGLWHHRSSALVGHLDWPEVAASAVAVGVTLLVLEVLDAHHAPAAATALLITTGLARPGRPLVGLVVGLAIVLAISPPLSVATRLPRSVRRSGR